MSEEQGELSLTSLTTLTRVWRSGGVSNTGCDEDERAIEAYQLAQSLGVEKLLYKHISIEDLGGQKHEIEYSRNRR